jgi:hypothetical protein
LLLVAVEAVCDYNLYFWSANFGHPGTYNDLKILKLLPLFHFFIDESIELLDGSYTIGGEIFDILAFLVHGKYTQRFIALFKVYHVQLLTVSSGFWNGKN